MSGFDRRDFIKLAGLGGVVFASGLATLGAGRTARAAEGGAQDDFVRYAASLQRA